MHLESYAEMSPEIEQLPLCINVKVIYHSKAPEKLSAQIALPASERDHGSGFIVSLSNVRVKVVVEVVGIIPTRLSLHVPLGLNKLTEDQVVQNRREYLTDVRRLEDFCQHSASARNHEITGEH